LQLQRLFTYETLPIWDELSTISNVSCRFLNHFNIITWSLEVEEECVTNLVGDFMKENGFVEKLRFLFPNA
jgi:hypothetical protein